MPSSSRGTDGYQCTRESCCTGDSRIARAGTEANRRISVCCRRDARPRASEPHRLRLYLRCSHLWVLPTSGASGEAPLQILTHIFPCRRTQPPVPPPSKGGLVRCDVGGAHSGRFVNRPYGFYRRCLHGSMKASTPTESNGGRQIAALLSLFSIL